MINEEKIKDLLMSVKNGKKDLRSAVSDLAELPYADIGIAKIDHHRQSRCGFPEVVLAKGKSHDQIILIVESYQKKRLPLIITKASERLYQNLKNRFAGLAYEKKARLIYDDNLTKQKKALPFVLLVTAGTSDISVAEEARLTLEIAGRKTKTLYDVGVAGIHRILGHLNLLRKAGVIIVFAGMDGALPSVVNSLVKCPLLAVPTSVGYGSHFSGIAPLLSMLNACSPGIAVCNIDNGFGAAVFAEKVLKGKK